MEGKEELATNELNSVMRAILDSRICASSFEKQCVILSTRLSSSSLIYFLNKDLEIYEENLHDIFGIKGELDLSMG